ncbi:cytochrome c oxidase subunit 4 isoform 1, mitochondrial [Drosophila grimshawi]|uniref:Cytochrome c oxidase subunit 4 n=1 Tax=Drosophila grimshawi TaxID=7222 RepID=B4JNV8_DROGR|nr:cytochrome c oxidase subunit 4 isoform 1, mitochondrial [Drosophila grimshawi]EDV92401.1 GH24897 [Drosophila grimshawi]
MNLLRFAGVRLPGAGRGTDRVSTISRRFTHHDATRAMGGGRELVGYGINGTPCYIDCADFPFPAIRYRVVDSAICALREKELGDWKKLTLPDKKLLYRHSFCQTYAEFQHFTPEWKLAVGIGLWSTAIAILIALIINSAGYDEYPETFQEERRQAQLRRIIHLQIEPITGLSSKWDYSQNKWK